MITAAHQPSEPSVVGGLPPDEADRLAALARYEVLDTPPEPALTASFDWPRCCSTFQSR